MPDAHSIPFRQASGNGHYESKQLPDDNADFLVVLGLPTSVGNVTSASVSTLDGQLAAYWGTSGQVIKASTLIGVVDLVDGKVTTRTSPTGDLVGTLGVQTLNNKTLVNCTVTSPVSGITKADVGLGNVDNTSDANKPVSGPQQTALNLKEDKANKGVANGYASLDATAKVPTSQLPAASLGAATYQGTWNALSNTPVIPAATAANKGWYYVVGIAGTTMVDGVNEWAIRDWIVSNGNTWDKIDNTDAVTSVSGRMGAVVLTKSDVGLDQVDNTSDLTKNSATATLTNKTINGNSNTLTVRLDSSDVVGNLQPAHLNSGAGATDASFWRGDGQWATPGGAGNVVGPAVSIDGEISLYNGTSGTVLRRAGGTGIVTVVSGVMQPPTDPAVIAPPVGSILDFAGATAPVGWLLCYGQAVARSVYVALFGVIGTLYGIGDGVNTFGVPDLRGRLIAGKDDMGGTMANRMVVSKTGNTTASNVTISAITGATDLVVGMSVVGTNVPVGCVIATIASPTSITVSLAPTTTVTGVALRFSIVDGAVLGAVGGNQVHQLTVAQLASHTHSHYQMLGGTGFATGTGYSYPATQTSPTGGDQAHPNVQPTIILNKIIKY